MSSSISVSVAQSAFPPSPPAIISAQLHVRRMDPSEIPVIMEVWKSIADKKRQEALSQQDPSTLMFRDSMKICELIAHCYREVPRDLPRSMGGYREFSPDDAGVRIYASEDQENGVQAIAVFQLGENHLKISYLVTHPHNIRSFLNETETHRMKGAGTRLVEEAKELAIKEHKDKILLVPLSSSRSFYEKLGFTMTDEDFRIMSYMTQSSLAQTG